MNAEKCRAELEGNSLVKKLKTGEYRTHASKSLAISEAARIAEQSSRAILMRLTTLLLFYCKEGLGHRPSPPQDRLLAGSGQLLYTNMGKRTTVVFPKRQYVISTT